MTKLRIAHQPIVVYRGAPRSFVATANADVPEGSIRCGCGRVVKALKSGFPRVHNRADGYVCPYAVGRGGSPQTLKLCDEHGNAKIDKLCDCEEFKDVPEW